MFAVEWRDGALMLVDAQEGEAYRLDPTDDPLRFVVRGGRPSGDAVRFLIGDDGRGRCSTSPATRSSVSSRLPGRPCAAPTRRRARPRAA